MQYVVRKFDEVLSTKSNRTELVQLRGESEALYMPKSEIENLNLKYEKLGTSYNLEDRLLNLCRHKLSGFIKVEKAFQKFFDPKMLDEILENKADTTMVNDLNRIKANYSDLAVTNSYIENLNERLK